MLVIRQRRGRGHRTCVEATEIPTGEDLKPKAKAEEVGDYKLGLFSNLLHQEGGDPVEGLSA
jgi:hypothetical protein